MKMSKYKCVAILMILVIAISLQAIAVQAFSVSGYTRIYEGVKYATGYVTSPRTMRAWAVKVCLPNPCVGICVTGSNGTAPYETALQTTPAFLTTVGAKVTTNASFFNADLSPNTDIWGLAMCNGGVVSAPDYAAPFNSQLNFTSSKIASLVVSNSYPAGGYDCLAGAEIILSDGVVLGGSSVLNPHTAMGLSEDGNYLIVVCVDGRQSGWSDGCSYPEMAQWLKDFGAWNGVMMDGGGSTCMVRADIGTVNRPCYGYARAVGLNWGVTSQAVRKRVVCDWDNDWVTDHCVFRPSDGGWRVEGKANMFFGLATDILVPADYNGDGKTDYGTWRPSDQKWYVRLTDGGDLARVVYGLPGDIPVPGDYDGDKSAEYAQFRPSNGTWYVYGVGNVQYGQSGDIPVPGDYNGDGATDKAVFRPSDGRWYFYGSPSIQYGQNGDIPVPGDYDGDSITDLAVYRPSDNGWRINGQATVFYGQAGDIPVPGDYNGDDITDIAIWRPSSGDWYVRGQATYHYGQNGDIPLPLPSAIRDFFF